MKSYSARVLAVIATVSVIINVLLFFRYSTSRPLVTVGSTVITKKQYLDQLEHDSGPPVLTRLVYTALVAQAASRAGVLPTEQDVKARVDELRRQSPQVLTPYTRDPAKMAQFQAELASNMALENLRIQDVALSPAQIADYYARHQADFALPPQTLMTTVVAKNAVDAGTAAVLLRQNATTDVISRQSGLRVVGSSGYNPDLQALPSAVKQQTSRWAQGARIGEIKTFRSGDFYLVFRVLSRANGEIPALADVRGQVERAARLELAPSPQEEFARLYQRAKPTFNSEKYAAYFAALPSPDSPTKTAEAP